MEGIDQLRAELEATVGAAHVTDAESELERHGHDESWHPTSRPDLVCLPGTTDEVAAVVRACHARRVPMVPFGAGTSLEGHVAALRGGVSIDLSRLDRILAVRPEDLDCTVQAGVTRRQLAAHLREDGVFFSVDPGADATLGGMAATGASGTTAVRYGTMRENVLSLTVVLPDGSIARTRSRARKSSAGYDLTHLMIGSEGTLGVICELTLRLFPLPEATSAAVVSFPSVRAAVEAATETIQLGLPVARIELLDALQMRAIALRSGLPIAERPTLFLDLHGSERGVREDADRLGAVVAGHGAEDYTWTHDPAEAERLWSARHQAYEAAVALRPGCRAMATDVCVPVSRLADCVEETRLDLDASGVMATILGHVGDGNFHLTILLDPDDPAEVHAAEALHDRLVQRALAMEGTCSGEHGVGYGKSGYLEAEHGPAALGMMRAVKAAIDPLDLMNPGKVLPAP
ncbi:MAG: FAD-binding oxidoreductase [Actinomycetota bacterium]